MDSQQRRRVTYRKSKWITRSQAYLAQIEKERKEGTLRPEEAQTELQRYIRLGQRTMLAALQAGMELKVGLSIKAHIETLRRAWREMGT